MQGVLGRETLSAKGVGGLMSCPHAPEWLMGTQEAGDCLSVSALESNNSG